MESGMALNVLPPESPNNDRKTFHPAGSNVDTPPPLAWRGVDASGPTRSSSSSDATHPPAPAMPSSSQLPDCCPSPLRAAGSAAMLLNGGAQAAASSHDGDVQSPAPIPHASPIAAEATAAAPLLQPSSGVPPGGRTAARGGPSRFRGVVWHKSNTKWEARIYESGKQKFLGYFTNENEAALAYDEYAIRIHGNAAKLNFPDRYAGVALPPPSHPLPTSRGKTTASSAAAARSRTPKAAGAASGGPIASPAPRRGGARAQPVKGSSRFRGVSWNSNCCKWRAQVWKGSEVHHLGYFEREEDAAHAYDEAVLRIRGHNAPTNYPRAEYGIYSDDEDQYASAPIHRIVSAKTSAMLGVSWSSAQSAWVAEIWDGRRYCRLGSFSTEAEAARVYDLACLEQHGVEALTNFPLSSYDAEAAALALRNLAEDPSGFNLAAVTVSAVAPGAGGVSPPTAASAPVFTNAAVAIAPPVAVETDGAAEEAAAVEEEEAGSSPRQLTSRFMGVSWERRKGLWAAHIELAGRLHPLGNFADELSAAKAYDLAASKLLGVGAALNFPSTPASAQHAAADSDEDSLAPWNEATAAAAAAPAPLPAVALFKDAAAVALSAQPTPAASFPRPASLASAADAQAIAQQQQKLAAVWQAARQVAQMAQIEEACRRRLSEEQLLQAVAAWEERCAVQHRMAVAAAAERWARWQQAGGQQAPEALHLYQQHRQQGMAAAAVIGAKRPPADVVAPSAQGVFSWGINAKKARIA